MRDIKILREEIDAIDQKLVELFEKRMGIVEEVAEFKIANDAPLKDPKREATLIKKNVALLKNDKYAPLLSVFFKDLMEYSRTYQKHLMTPESEMFMDDFTSSKVAYQGIEGSFSSIALKYYFRTVAGSMPYKNFEDVFVSLMQGESDYGILPIENSSTGAINEVYDLLKKYQVAIVGDYYLPIKHHLIGSESSNLDSIESVYSHEQGFKQSQLFLKQHEWQHYTYFNTAKSVQFVKEKNDPTIAAIGSAEAAEVYGLKILKANIHDNDYNTTRFVIISKTPKKDEKANKISMIIRLSHEPQSLFHVLEKIAQRGVNMLKIESRPVPEKPWEYLFYVDIEGSFQNVAIKQLMFDIEQVAHGVTVLGNYYSRNGVTK